MITKHDLSRERLREVLSYDPATGIFTWLISKGSVSKGRTASSIEQQGYVVIRIDGLSYKAHRLAWLYVYGKWPSLLDHINGVCTDNRIANLREATYSQNQQNSRPRYTGKSHFKGASRDRGKWRATIVIDGRQKYLGGFNTPEEAHARYCQVAQETFGEFARGA